MRREDNIMIDTIDSSVYKEVIKAVDIVPLKKLPILLQFAKFLSSTSDTPEVQLSSQTDVLVKRKKISGILKGKITIADDFNETPVLLPPLSEQKQIALKLSSIDSAIERIEKNILFSQQIKQELIDKVL